MPITSDAERVRTWVEDNVIQPARARGDRTFTVTAGDVHRDLGLKNRVPLVCQALKSKRLLEKNHLVLKDVSGPPSGLTTRLRITYEISADENAPARNPLWGLRGIAKDIFRQLGGGENFLSTGAGRTLRSPGETGIINDRRTARFSGRLAGYCHSCWGRFRDRPASALSVQGSR